MIPKKIHYCWLSGDDYPPLVQNCIASWKKYLPDYEIVLWDLNKISATHNVWIEQAYAAKKYAFAADYIRLYAVYHFGGIYLDSDVEIKGTFNSFLHHKSFIGFESTGDIEPAVFGAEANTAWVKYCLDYYDGRTFIKDNGQFDQIPLPMIVKQRMEDYFSIKIEPLDNNILTMPEELIICPSEYFSPKNYHTRRELLTANTVAIHHFDGNWVPKTFVSKLKLGVHRFLYWVVGGKGHYKITKLIRKLNV